MKRRGIKIKGLLKITHFMSKYCARSQDVRFYFLESVRFILNDTKIFQKKLICINVCAAFHNCSLSENYSR